MSSTLPATQFDLAVVQRAYRECVNLRVLDRPCLLGRRRALVFFSSNGLYFPNTESAASKVLIEQDRFEWFHTIPPNFSRVLLIRDVYKTWYLRGISPEFPDPFSLSHHLRRLLDGWDVQMAGVSSGGFAAVLFGCLVGARRVFSLAGQFSLDTYDQDPHQRALNPLVVQATGDPSLEPFLDVRRHFGSSMPEIYYVVPCRSTTDHAQRKLAESDPRIRLISVDSDQHDANLLRPALRRMFHRPSSYFDRLIQQTPPSGWDRIELSRKIAGNRRHFSYLLRRRRDLLRR